MSQPTTPSRTVTVVSAVTAFLATGLLALAGVLAYDSARSDGDLAGVGYVVAALIAAPGAFGLAFAIPALALRRQATPTARALAWTGLAATVLPSALMLTAVGPL